MNKTLSSLLFLLVLLTLTACTSLSQKDRDFYQGFKGVELSFTRNTPPSELLISEGETNVKFDIEVRVANKGASLSKGGVYLSGYDPSLIRFDEVEEDRGFFDDCVFRIQDLGFNVFSGFVRCARLDLKSLGQNVGLNLFFSKEGGSPEFWVNLKNIAIGELLNKWLDTDFFTKLGLDSMDVSFKYTEGGKRLDVSFDGAGLDPALGVRGPYFLKLWSPISFDFNGGREYLLPGDVPEFPGGGEEYFTFHGTFKELPEDFEEITQQILVTNCYLYTTYAAPVVCVDAEPRTSKSKACTPKPYFSKKGQGGPVAVTSVTQRNTGDSLLFRIEVENVGSGTVYNPLHIQACNPRYPLPVSEQDLNTVVIGRVYLGNTRLLCEPNNYQVRLYNGRGVFNCVYPLSFISSTGYESPLVIELWYGYSQTVKAVMKVKQVRY